MSDFLLELRCEEIPARMQAKARADLEKLFAAQLKDAGLEADSITTYSTPRRLALIARGLPDQTEAVSEERKGPAASAPEQALAGFLRSTGLKREDLVERDVKGKAVLFAIIEKPGQPTADILARAIPSIIAAFPWPKSQRWGAASISSESLKWVRPLQGIIALFGDKVVDCDVHGIISGRETMGHRFHSEGAIEVTSADDYADKLRSAHVIVDHQERQNIIREGAAKAANDAGLSLVEDEGLVVENAGLTEWPVPLLGRFDASFLDVPEEVIQLTTRINQKYFVAREKERDKAGKLTNAFVCTANIDATDGGDAIIAGNEKVLAARLGDAKFFWELDQKTTLAVHAEKLSNIVFHEQLGTVADKVDRVTKLARLLCEQGIVRNSLSLEGSANAQGEDAHSSAIKAPHPDLLPNGEKETLAEPVAKNTVHPEPVEGQDNAVHASTSSARTAEELADLAEQAAKLCKADLVTEMVGEFPELQGLMGGYYAAKEGLDPAVSNAIRDHYKPVGQSDDVPTDPVTIAVSLADKLDTLAAYFTAGEKPTGSKDPFALRRAALGAVKIIEINSLRISLNEIFQLDQSMIPSTFLNGYSTYYDIVPHEHSKEYDPQDFEFDPRKRKLFTEALGRIKVTDCLQFEGVHPEPASYKVLFELPSPYLQRQSLLKFFADRLKVQQKEAGVRHDLIDAVFATKNEKGEGEDDLVRLLARVHALQSFVETEDGVNLLAGYKRASNILKKEGDHTTVIPAKAGIQHETSAGLDSRLRGNDESAQNDESAKNSVRPEPVEGQSANGLRQAQSERMLETPADEPAQSLALQGALSAAETKAAAAIESEDFEGAMSALASLRHPIDAFFDGVMVNDDDADKKKFRLGLLSRFRDAVHTVADFSKIEG